jgi:hypothetical protein
MQCGLKLQSEKESKRIPHVKIFFPSFLDSLEASLHYRQSCIFPHFLLSGSEADSKEMRFPFDLGCINTGFTAPKIVNGGTSANLATLLYSRSIKEIRHCLLTFARTRVIINRRYSTDKQNSAVKARWPTVHTVRKSGVISGSHLYYFLSFTHK